MSSPLWEKLKNVANQKITFPLITTDPEKLVREILSAEINLIAEEVERRGDEGLDWDPGETADWLRSEAIIAEDKDPNFS